jgi:excisionase family DNA binding protein
MPLQCFPMPFELWDESLSTSEVAETLGVSSRSVHRLIDDGQLTAFRIGRVLRIDKTEVARFLDDH